MVAYVSQDVEAYLTIMQGDKPPIYIMYEEMGKLLSSQVCEFIEKAHPYKSSYETLELKAIKELVKFDKFDVSNKEHADIGMKAETLFHSTLLSNDAKEVTFRNECLSFYQVVTTFLGASVIPCLTS